MLKGLEKKLFGSRFLVLRVTSAKFHQHFHFKDILIWIQLLVSIYTAKFSGRFSQQHFQFMMALYFLALGSKKLFFTLPLDATISNERKHCPDL